MPPESAVSLPFFETPARSERLQLLLHLMRNAGPAVYLRGPDGAGKTRFARRLAEALEGEIECVTLDATMQADMGAALTALSANPGGSLGEVMQELAARPLLLSIDNADELVSATAGVLASWHDAGGRLLLIGRGKPEALNELLELQYVDLPPFTEQESADFLRQQSGEVASRVTPDLAAAVHRAAGGLPGPLLQALNGMLAESAAAADGRRDRAKAAAPKGRSGLAYWVAATLILVLVAAGMVYQDRINALFEPPAPEVTTPHETAAGSRITALDPAKASGGGDAEPDTDSPPVAVPMPRIELPELSPPSADRGDTIGESAPQAPAAEPVPGPGGIPAVAEAAPARAESGPTTRPLVEAEQPAAEAEQPAAEAEQPTADAEQPTAEPEQPAADDPLEAVMADAIAAAEAQTAKPVETPARREGEQAVDVPPVSTKVDPPTAKGAEDARSVVARLAPAAPVEPAAPTSAPPAPVEERRPASSPEPKAVVREEAPSISSTSPTVPTPGDGGDAWLASRKSDHYTLQLVGARERGSIEKFIRDHAIAAPYAIFSRDLGGRPWYSLVAGDYPDRAAAVAARARLPARLRGRDVWPRTFESIKKAE